MKTFPSTAARALLAIAVVGAAAVGPLGSSVASARPGKAPRPALTVVGSGTWAVRPELGDAVVNGTGEITGPLVGNGHWHHRGRDRDVQVAAVVGPDDRTLPGPGECEHAMTTVSVYGARGIDLTLIGDGDVCGLDVQPPTSIVTHAFTGTFEVYGDTTRPRRLLGTDGFFEVRLAQDGTAHVFAIDT
jgi:hypothetical protein